MEAAEPRARLRSVQSRGNARLKELRTAFARPGAATDGLIGIEGEHLLKEALRSGLRFETVFVRSGSEALLERLALPREVDLIELPPQLFDTALPTERPQGVAALVHPPVFTSKRLFGTEGQRPLLLVLEALQDPGNLGTLLRSAEAFGATGVAALRGTVHRWNGKSLRASAGSAFRIPFVTMDEHETFQLLAEHGVKALAAVARGGTAAYAAVLTEPLALLIGNEGAGLSTALLARAQGRVTLPCPGAVESLNAAVAGSLLLYECSRQRAMECSRQQAMECSRQQVAAPDEGAA